MPNVKVYNMDGTVAEEIMLKDEVFGVEVSESAIHQVVVAHNAAARQGTQSALLRGEVSGGGIKPWRQKGTGRARQGSTRAPQWRHGGVVFAPKPREYSKKVNKQIRALAMKSALTMKLASEELIVVKDLELEAGKTKEIVKVLENLKAAKKTLIVTKEKNELVCRAANNIPTVNTGIITAIGVYDIVNCDSLVVTEAAVRKVEEVYSL
ncbi:MAG: 50S ribosomal protein L4 [Clostridia bacterium]|nr:50S ribosomal protein L4 [Clostridia bacterium]